MGHFPATSPTILIRLRLKILWSGWPAPKKMGERKHRFPSCFFGDGVIGLQVGNTEVTVCVLLKIA